VGPSFFANFILMHKLYKTCLKDAEYEISLYLDYWFTRRRTLNEFSNISLCKIKCPLVGPFLGGFYFYAQTLQTMSLGCCMSNIGVFGMPVHEKKI